MNTRFIILIMIFIFISSCDKDDLELYNCQDINNNCYLEPLENFGVFSYSPSENSAYRSSADGRAIPTSSRQPSSTSSPRTAQRC